MVSYRTKRSHTRSRINSIFSRVVFLERKLSVSVFSSLFMWGGISPVESDFEWQSQRKNYFKKWVFLCRQSFYPAKKFIWSEDLLFSSLISCIDQELFCFSFDSFFFFYFLPIFDRESFFSFSFLSFHFFLSDL